MSALQPPAAPAAEALFSCLGSWPSHLHDALLAVPHAGCNYLAAHVCATYHHLEAALYVARAFPGWADTAVLQLHVCSGPRHT